MTTVRQENDWLSDTIPSHLCSVADLGEGPGLPSVVMFYDYFDVYSSTIDYLRAQFRRRASAVPN